MRNRVTAQRGRILAKAGAVAVLAGLGAACSAETMRIKEPFFTGSTRNQQSIIGGQQQVASSAQLPPPPGTSGPINLAGGAPAPAYGGGYNTGGGTVVVAQGETLEIIAMRYGVPVQSLAQANGITSAAQVVPGRALVIPQAGGAPVAYASADSLPTPAPVAVPVAASASGGVIHVVEPGQTLFGIAQAQGVSMQDIMAANGMTSQTVRIGQRLKIPSAGGGATVQTASLNGSQTLGAPPQTLGTLPSPGSEAMPTTAPDVRVIDTASAPPPAPEVPAVTAPAPAKVASLDTSTDPPSANGTSFRWPVRGRIIADYGSKPTGERNDGINLAVPEGTAVKAAEAGTVIYAGNELAGYGNLVLVRHADGWVSAYAHNSTLGVSKGDTVQRGQTIAQAGMTGSVNSPQVHFELRKGAKPVNPLDYLSGT